ncbi:MAG TPA: GntR family transcriptional regulator [Pirellulales bacterium]|nr:GntR family transcriptional regulator [Pirellulales bacterium]
MQFSINPTSGMPIYQQLSDQICAGVARGQLRTDQRLPSVRELSQLLVINPNTVARTYTELEREGVLYTRPGMGVFIAPLPRPLSKKSRRERLLGSVDRLLVDAVRFGFTAEEFTEFVEERIKQFQWSPATAAASQ